MSTSSGNATSGKNMKPHGYSNVKLDYPISDIWLIKKDTDNERLWCKIIKHWELDSDFAIVSFGNLNVLPNDFYYITIMQKDQYKIKDDKYMAFLDPISFDNVV